MSITINKNVKFDGTRCPFSTFLRLQGDHHCAGAQKWCPFSYFSKSFQTKRIKAIRPKMTKIASMGGGGGGPDEPGSKAAMAITRTTGVFSFCIKARG